MPDQSVITDRFCLNHGEHAIDNAPTVRLRNGVDCVPQHFLRYAHTRVSVERLVMKIDYDRAYPIFVSEDAGGVYVQIGIIGRDNYTSLRNGIAKNPKLVFGRRWRVEPNLPTSEILQTVCLALKKAREHEMRELFKVAHKGRTTTPMSNHHDLPLMARNTELLHAGTTKVVSLDCIISRALFDGGHFELADVETTRSGVTVLELIYVAKRDAGNPPHINAPLIVTLKALSPSAVLHGMMDAILQLSDAYVDENFAFEGFARFSRSVDVLAIADLSAALRRDPATLTRAQKDKAAFAKTYAQEKYDTDNTRVPVLHSGPYADALRAKLAGYTFANGVKV